MFGLAFIGIVAHEWFMRVAAITEYYVHTDRNAIDLWLQTFGPNYAGLVLTATELFVRPHTEFYTGVRQNSGDLEPYSERLPLTFSNLATLKALRPCAFQTR